jgi:hypothetical protein
MANKIMNLLTPANAPKSLREYLAQDIHPIYKLSAILTQAFVMNLVVTEIDLLEMSGIPANHPILDYIEKANMGIARNRADSPVIYWQLQVKPPLNWVRLRDRYDGKEPIAKPEDGPKQDKPDNDPLRKSSIQESLL